MSSPASDSTKCFAEYARALKLATVRWSPGLKVLSWDEGAAAMFGYSDAEARALDFPNLVAGSGRVQFEKSCRRACEGESAKAEIAIVSRDGHLVEVCLCVVPLCDEEDGSAGCCGIFENITSRKTEEHQLRAEAGLWHQTEEALRARERDFRTFFEMIDVGNVIADAHTKRFVQVNRRFCELTGYSAEELHTMTPDDLTAAEDLERDCSGWAQALEENLPSFTIEKRYVHKDGKTIWVQVTSTLVKDVDGRPLHAIGVVRDITDRRQALIELEKTRGELEELLARRGAELAATTATARETAHRFETVVENSPLAIISLDLQARVLLWNAASEQLFGWGESEVLGQRAPTLPEEEYDFYEAELLALVTSSQRTQIETKRQRRDGIVFDVVMWRAPLFNTDGEVVASIAILMDVTERKFLERALFESSERESRRIGQELHDDLCQHLLGAAFAAKAATTSVPAGSDVSVELNDLAQLINSAVKKARDIARGLNPVELDSAGLMAALQELTERPHGLKCRLECMSPVLLPDSAAALHAYRVAEEAVANAVRHARASKVIVRLKEDSEHVHLQIEDDGKGLPAEAFTSKGLGIRTMRSRVQAMGGSIAFDTSKHGGTRVNCTLPKRK